MIGLIRVVIIGQMFRHGTYIPDVWLGTEGGVYLEYFTNVSECCYGELAPMIGLIRVVIVGQMFRHGTYIPDIWLGTEGGVYLELFLPSENNTLYWGAKSKYVICLVDLASV